MIAFSNIVFKFFFPYFFNAVSHACTTPGTDIDRAPLRGIFFKPFELKYFFDAFKGDFPDPFITVILFFFESYQRAILSPPRPFILGIATASVVAVAIAASIALPPFFNIFIPALVASL